MNAPYTIPANQTLLINSSINFVVGFPLINNGTIIINGGNIYISVSLSTNGNGTILNNGGNIYISGGSLSTIGNGNTTNYGSIYVGGGNNSQAGSISINSKLINGQKGVITIYSQSFFVYSGNSVVNNGIIQNNGTVVFQNVYNGYGSTIGPNPIT